MADLHLHVEGLVKRFGGLTATNHLDLEVERGELHAVIGPNGAGKTTLISQLSGTLQADEGKIIFDGRDITRAAPYAISQLGLARSFQITSIFLNFTPRTTSPWPSRPIPATPSASGARRRATRRCASRRARRWSGSASATAPTPLAANLSHGEQRQLEIAMAIATEPPMLLLDEPMAGMGPRNRADDRDSCRLQEEPHDPADRARHGRGVQAGRPDHRARLRRARSRPATPDGIRANEEVRTRLSGRGPRDRPDA